MPDEKEISRTEKIPGFLWARVGYWPLHKLSKIAYPILILVVLLYLIYSAILLWQNCFRQKWTEHIPELHGKSVDEVIAKLGNPHSTKFFTLDHWLGRPRSLMFDFYPPNKPENLKVQIMEMGWEYYSFYIRVWFHKVDGEWVVLHTLKWKKGVEF